ncbi:MAG: glycosyltransferase family A protein, partial [Candidatus Thiodiazotropha sp.]
MPCVNSFEKKRKSIELTLKQLLRQNYESYEIVCVTGGNKDGTEQYLKDVS